MTLVRHTKDSFLSSLFTLILDLSLTYFVGWKSVSGQQRLQTADYRFYTRGKVQTANQELNSDHGRLQTFEVLLSLMSVNGNHK